MNGKGRAISSALSYKATTVNHEEVFNVMSLTIRVKYRFIGVSPHSTGPAHMRNQTQIICSKFPNLLNGASRFYNLIAFSLHERQHLKVIIAQFSSYLSNWNTIIIFYFWINRYFVLFTWELFSYCKYINSMSKILCHKFLMFRPPARSYPLCITKGSQ